MVGESSWRISHFCDICPGRGSAQCSSFYVTIKRPAARRPYEVYCKIVNGNRKSPLQFYHSSPALAWRDCLDRVEHRECSKPPRDQDTIGGKKHRLTAIFLFAVAGRLASWAGRSGGGKTPKAQNEHMFFPGCSRSRTFGGGARGQPVARGVVIGCERTIPNDRDVLPHWQKTRVPKSPSGRGKRHPIIAVNGTGGR